MSNLIDAVTAARLDDLTAYCATILNHIHGSELDSTLAGTAKRYGRSDTDFRTAALNGTHPDDLVAALASKGFTLARFGIVSIGR